MTQEEKQLLLKDLCARLPYGVKYKDAHGYKMTLDIWSPEFHTALNTILYDGKPSLYLRPMSSMTEEERNELEVVCGIDYIDEKIVDFGEFLCEGSPINIKNIYGLFDWLNSHHFDYRGLIEKGLAIEALEGMYEF